MCFGGGKKITVIQKRWNGWVEHFEELSNRPASLRPPNIETAHMCLPVVLTSPTIEEITMSTRQIKNEKTARLENTATEALTSGIGIIAKMLPILLRRVWEEKQVPTN